MSSSWNVLVHITVPVTETTTKCELFVAALWNDSLDNNTEVADNRQGHNAHPPRKCFGHKFSLSSSCRSIYLLNRFGPVLYGSWKPSIIFYRKYVYTILYICSFVLCIVVSSLFLCRKLQLDYHKGQRSAALDIKSCVYQTCFDTNGEPTDG